MLIFVVKITQLKCVLHVLFRNRRLNTKKINLSTAMLPISRIRVQRYQTSNQSNCLEYIFFFTFNGFYHIVHIDRLIVQLQWVFFCLLVFSFVFFTKRFSKVIWNFFPNYRIFSMKRCTAKL